jgi:hypothetical protein
MCQLQTRERPHTKKWYPLRRERYVVLLFLARLGSFGLFGRVQFSSGSAHGLKALWKGQNAEVERREHGRAAQGCPGCSFRAALRTMGIRDSWPGTMRLFDQHVHISTSTCQPRSSQARGWFLSALRHIECRAYTKEHPKPRCGDVCVTGATLFLLSNPRSRVGQSPDLNLTRLWARCGHPKLPRTLAAYPCAYPCRRATLLEDPGSPSHAPTACGDFLPSLQKSHVSLRAASLKADAEA